MNLGKQLAWALLACAVAACDSAPQFDPLPAGTPVLAFGDSVTHGTGARRGEDYPTQLAERSGWRITNAGIPGDTADAARSRIVHTLGNAAPALVIVELGGNDFLRRTPAAKVKEYLREIIRAVRDYGAEPVLVAVPELALFSAAVGRLSDSPIYEELADEEGVLLISDVLSDILTDESLRADRIHPNAAGYRRLADGTGEALYAAGLLTR